MKNQTLHDWTPVIESAPLSQLTGQQVFLKMDCYQPVGSFKIRGIGRLAQYYASIGKNHLIASSGGNAGYAVAYAGKQLNCHVTVFLPDTSKQIYVDAIKSMGAEIKIIGHVWDEAHAAASEFCKKVDGAYLPPFDHPLIWAGHSTIIEETAAAGIKPDAVVVAVGGGGLACGLLSGMQAHGWYDVPLIAVETTGAGSFAAAIAAGKVVKIPEITSIATSLGAKQVCQEIFDWTKRHPIQSILVSDLAAMQACQKFLDQHYALVEPSCGAALSVVYDQHPALKKFKSILIVVCGGIGITVDWMQEFLKQNDG